MLSETNFRYDIEKVLPLLSKVQWDEKNRCALNFPTGHWLYDPYEICETWKNTEFEKLLTSLPFSVGEARLMKLPFGKCYLSHADVDDRIHINLISNQHSYLIDLTTSKMYPLSADGKLYYMDGAKIHTAANFGSTDRVQLVIRIPLKRYTKENFITKTIEFLNPTVDLRYILDNNLSSHINQFIKSGSIGYFNPVNDTTVQFHLSPETFDILIKKTKQIHKHIKIYD